jgi:TolB-like protein/Flp pilus assembly protein TadD
VQEDAGIIYLIKTDPYLKKIRCDPRFPALVEKLGLPPGGEVGCRPQAGSSGAPVSPSIAVLPFADMSPKHDQEYFADGVAEEILNGLSQVRGLKVIGRTSSFSFKGKNDDLRAIGRKLNAGTILEGSVRKDGGRLRITAKLIRAEDGAQLWSQVFDRSQAGVFAVQEEIARAVASALRITLIPSITAPTVNPDAYNQYLLGRQFAQQGTVEGFRRALAAFRKAVRLDPTFAQAQARLADSLRFLSGMEGERSLDKILEDQRQSLAEADRAVEMGPGVPDGYLVRAFIRNDLFRDWKGGRADVEKARQLGPENAELLYHEAVVLSSAGQIAPAIDRLERAAVLDPLSPRIWAELGHMRLAVRQTDAAREAFRRGIEIAPDHFRANLGAALAELQAGNTPAALTLFQRNPFPSRRLWGSAMCLDRLGRRGEAQAALEQLIRDHGHSAAYEVAQVYAARSDRDAAFDWLERAYRQRDASTAFLKFDPILDSLRGDPRYAALLRKVNLPVD